MYVQDVMTPQPVTIQRQASVKEALTMLARYSVTSLPVVTASGRICGVVSEADLIRESVARDHDIQETPIQAEAIDPPRLVEQVYTPHAVTVRADTDLSDAVELMTSTSVKSLPVVDDRDRVIGIISRSDVVQLLARSDNEIEREVHTLLVAMGHEGWLVEVHDGIVEITSPDLLGDSSLVGLAVDTIPGVVEVRIN